MGGNTNQVIMNASIAQLGERGTEVAEVAGSKPAGSTQSFLPFCLHRSTQSIPLLNVGQPAFFGLFSAVFPVLALVLIRLFASYLRCGTAPSRAYREALKLIVSKLSWESVALKLRTIGWDIGCVSYPQRLSFLRVHVTMRRLRRLAVSGHFFEFRYRRFLRRSMQASIAQLGERGTEVAEVAGSKPAGSSFFAFLLPPINNCTDSPLLACGPACLSIALP